MLLIADSIDNKLERLHAIIVFGQSLRRNYRDGRSLFVAPGIFDLHRWVLIRANDQLVFFQAEVRKTVGVRRLDVETERIARNPCLRNTHVRC